MNSIKSKRFIVTILTFVMFMALAFQLLPAAKVRHGATVEVTMADGRTIRGELLAVKGHDLIIHDKSLDRGFAVNIDQVSKVRIKRISRILAGLSFGLVAGLGIGTGIYAAQSAHESDPCQLTPYAILAMIIPCVTTVIGGGIGAIASLPEQVLVNGKEAAQLYAYLRHLQQHARY